MEDDCDFEHSQLSGRFTYGKITVEVEIYRNAGTNDPWKLEIINENGECIRWYNCFDTENDAYQASLQSIEADSISILYSNGPGGRH